MRILHVIPSLRAHAGGPTVAALQLCAALGELGHDVAIATTNLEGAIDWRLRRRQVLPRPTGKMLPHGSFAAIYFDTRWPHRYAFSPGLARWLDGHVRSFDIVHIHSLYIFTSWWAARACRRAGVPYIIRPHGTLEPFLTRRGRIKKRLHWLAFERWAVEGAAAMHYTSDQERASAEAWGVQRPAIVLGHGFDFEPYRELPSHGRFRARHPEIGDRPIVLFLGRLHAKKGLDVLVRAAARLRAEGQHNAVLGIAGSDEGEEAGLRRLARELGCEEDIIFIGFVSGSDKLELLRDADMWVLSSHTENFGVGVLEAMAAGLPVVVTPEVALSGRIAAAQAGLVAPRDPSAFATAIQQLLGDRDAAQKLGQNGRRLVREGFSWDGVAREMAAQCKRIIGSG